MTNKIIHGDNLEVLKTYPENFFHSVVTDPPYGLKFMNKHWDYDVPQVEFWREVLRVLKPGGYVLSFGGTRTYHRMAVNIEDAGFIIRDQLQWIYGSGFPKSLNIGKAVDKSQGNEKKKIGERLGHDIRGGALMEARDPELKKENNKLKITITQGSSEWEGYGTALKPANEPICLAMKPLSEKNFAENVLKWGTGGMNIDGCRVGTEQTVTRAKRKGMSFTSLGNGQGFNGCDESINQGRFPSNVILDEEAGALLDKQSGVTISKSTVRKNKVNTGKNGIYNNYNAQDSHGFDGFGGASRFFYCSKASSSERNAGMRWDSEKKLESGIQRGSYGSFNGRSNYYKNYHVSVKPLNLMRYLVRLVTPKGGIVLEPFAGSGTTLLAAKKEGFEFVGIERELEYCKIAEQRLEAVAINGTLF
jgi:site-specific DNA-methyltransferase (adenine-specific)